MNRVRLGIVGLVAMLAAVAGLTISTGAGDGGAGPGVGQQAIGTEAGAPDPTAVDTTFPEDLRRWNRPALPPVPAPAGKVPMAFDDGGRPGLAGYVDEATQDIDAVAPELDLGSGRYPISGWEVTDLDGVLLGYVIGGIGLVDLETAQDVEALDALLAKAEVQREAAEAAPPWPSEEEIEEMFEADGGG